MHGDHRVEPERVAQPIGRALRLVARGIRANEDAKEAANLTDARLHPDLADRRRDMREEILGVGVRFDANKRGY